MATYRNRGSRWPVSRLIITRPPHQKASTNQPVLTRDRQLARQQAALTVLRQEIASLRAERSQLPAATLPDMKTLQQWIAGWRAAWRGSPDAQRTEALLRQAILAEKQIAELEAAARKSEQSRHESQEELHTLRAALKESEQQRATEQNMTRQARNELLSLSQRLQWVMTPEQLKDEQMRRSYAAGSALGKDIQGLVSERQSWGVPIEWDGLLAGVIDSISGHLLLPAVELNRLSAQADAAAITAREKWVNAQQRRDGDYLGQFSKQKGVKQSTMGFWYRVDYAGEGELTKDAVIDVVVKETLTDGTVIQDMALSGKVLSQPLSKYPPLFREAIGHLRNHGSLTMVVPPDLAYGETGYPPQVPPNATMVYELRIDNSQSGSENSGNVSQ